MLRVDQVPLLWDREGEFRARSEGRILIVFLDYDGTLTPIVEDYNKAVLSDEMRQTIAALARQCTVAIVSGRDVATMRNLVRLEPLFYAGSHGFEIGGPKGWHDAIEKGVEALPALDRAERELREEFGDRRVTRSSASASRSRSTSAAPPRPTPAGQVVDRVTTRQRQLRKGRGKKVRRLQPRHRLGQRSRGAVAA